MRSGILFLVFSLCILMGSSIEAQIPILDENSISVEYQQEKFEGSTYYMLFHKFDPAVFNQSHQHLVYSPFQNSTEQIRSFQIKGQYHLNSRLQFGFNLPFITKKRTFAELDSVQVQKGLGDFSLFTKYKLFQTELFKPDAKFKQLVLIGFSVRFPIAKFEDFTDLGELEPDLQLGSGAWGFNGIIDYRLQFLKWNAYLSGSYLLNLDNKYTFEYGNELDFKLDLVYEWDINSQIQLLPNLGFAYWQMGQNKMHGVKISETTERKVFSSKVGFAINYSKIRLGASINIPVLEKISDRQLETKPSFLISASCLFGKAKTAKITNRNPDFK